MMESWDLETDLVEAVEFVAVAFLDELQEDVILMLHSGWPIDADNGELASPYAAVDDKRGTLYMSFQVQGRTILSFDPINLKKLLGGLI